MGFWRRLFGGSSTDDLRPQRLDYLNEALALERQGDYDAALTSYRLALRDHPADARILQNMAIAFTKTRRYDEAIRHYRRALELDQGLAGAHYGLAFLLLKRGDPDGAAQHLRRFLSNPPRGPDGQKWIEHAMRALRDLDAPAPAAGAAEAT
jgi:tetratricopeptide (TPR) repeat protein